MGLQDDFQNEKVNQLEIRDAPTASPIQSVRDCVEIMRDKNLGCVMVVGQQQKPIGMFTESMVIEILADDPSGMDDPVEKRMAKRYPWVRDTDPIADLVTAMENKNIRILCVLDKDDRVVGVTGQRGVMEYVADHFPGKVMVQRIGLPPYMSDREGA